MPANESQFWLVLGPRLDACWWLPAGIFLPRRDIVYCRGSWPSLRIISGKIRRLAFMNQLQTYIKYNMFFIPKKHAFTRFQVSRFSRFHIFTLSIRIAEKRIEIKGNTTDLQYREVRFLTERQLFAIARIGIVSVLVKPSLQYFHRMLR